MLKSMRILTLPVIVIGMAVIFFHRSNELRTVVLLALLVWCVVLAKLDDSDKRIGK